MQLTTQLSLLLLLVVVASVHLQQVHNIQLLRPT